MNFYVKTISEDFTEEEEKAFRSYLKKRFIQSYCFPGLWSTLTGHETRLVFLKTDSKLAVCCIKQ